MNDNEKFSNDSENNVDNSAPADFAYDDSSITPDSESSEHCGPENSDSSSNTGEKAELDIEANSGEEAESDEEANSDEKVKSDEKPKKKFRLRAIVFSLISGLLAGSIITLIAVPNALGLWLGGDSAYSKLSEIQYLVNRNFIDSEKLDKDFLADMMAYGYVYALGDKYSAYLDKKSYSALLYSNSGGSEGIGVNIVSDPDSGGIYITEVSVGSPADKAGLKRGDIITHVEGETITSDNYTDSVGKIRGKNGTSVKLTVKSGDTVSDIVVKRGKFTETTVFSHMIGDAGYIKITSFSEATVDQFNDAIDFVKSEGAKKLIFDLRDNSGGLVDSASKMLDVLLPKGEIGYVIYNHGKRSSLAKSDAACVKLPMSVIVNSGTASSAEYFTSALRDSANATVVGETTYGKGIMQQTYPLGDGSALRITVAKFYTESGTEIHGKGIKPDKIVSLTDDQRAHIHMMDDSSDPYILAAK